MTNEVGVLVANLSNLKRGCGDRACTRLVGDTMNCGDEDEGILTRNSEADGNKDRDQAREDAHNGDANSAAG